MSHFYSRTTRAYVRMPRIVCVEKWLGECGVLFFPLRHIHYILWGDFQFYSIIFFYSFLHFIAADGIAAAATLLLYVRAFVYVFYIYSRVASDGVRRAHSHTCRVHVGSSSSLLASSTAHTKNSLYIYPHINSRTNVREKIILAHEYVYGDGFSFRI